LLAYRLYKYYVIDDVQWAPHQARVEEFAQYIVDQNFELLPSVRWLLTRTWMYESASMSALHYKNPTELVIWTMKILHQNDTKIDINTYHPYLLNTFAWVPYYPGSIFWRDGFDNNQIWMNEYILNQWMSYSTFFAYNQEVRDNGAGHMWTWSYELTWAQWLLWTIPATPSDLIDSLQNALYINRTLSPTVRTDIENYLTSGWTITYDPLDSAYMNVHVRWAIAMMLVQPEFILVAWHNNATMPVTTTPSIIDWPNKIVFLELFGGYDWIYGLIPRDQYRTYVQKRSILAVPLADMIDVWSFFMNTALSPLYDLFQQWNLTLINGVWNPYHSRWHDTAQRQSTSYYNKQILWSEWVFGHLIKNDIPENTYVISTIRPNIFSHGKYINIGPNSSEIQFVAQPWSVIPSGEKTLIVQAIRTVLTNRTVYPDTVEVVYDGAKSLDTVAGLPGPSRPWYNLAWQLAYIQKLMDNNMWSAYYAIGWGWFDTHAKQQEENVLTNKMVSYAEAIKGFFDAADAAGHNVTIVVHTEFGRTIKRNGTDWTDHGKWWWYFIISNNNNIESSFADKTYGDINLDLNKKDRLWVWIDYRAIYKNIFDALYNYTPPELASFALSDEIDTTPPRIYHMRPQYKSLNNGSLSVILYGQVADVNFRPLSMGAHIFLWWWDTATTMQEENIRNIERNVIQSDTEFMRKKDRQPQWQKRWFAGTWMDNQHAITPFSGVLDLPVIVPSPGVTLSSWAHTILRTYNDTTVAWSFPVNIPLAAATTYISPTWFGSISSPIATTIVSLEWNDTWHGGVILPESLYVDTFVWPQAILTDTGMPLDSMYISHLMRVWPDTLGLSMKTTDPVTISINNVPPLAAWYDVITSTDGITRSVFTSDVQPQSGVLSFVSDTLQLYALVDTSTPQCEIIAKELPWVFQYELARETQNTNSWNFDGWSVLWTWFSWSHVVTLGQNQFETFSLTAQWTGWATTCSTTIDTRVDLTFQTPSCVLNNYRNPDGTYTLVRSFAWTQPLAASLIGAQDVWDITDLSMLSTVTSAPVQSISTYTMTVLWLQSSATCSTTINTIAPTTGWWTSGWWSTPSDSDGAERPKTKWGWVRAPALDVCPKGDFSPSYYDNTCGFSSSKDPKNNDSTNGDVKGDTNGDIKNDTDNDWQTTTNWWSASETRKQTIDRLFAKLETKYKSDPAKLRRVFSAIQSIVEEKKWPVLDSKWQYLVDAARRIETKYNTTRVSEQDVVSWLYDNWFTSFDTLVWYRWYKEVKREHAAKMLLVAMQLRWETIPSQTNTSCMFADTKDVNPDLLDDVLNACKAWIMQWYDGKFHPDELVSYAQATVMAERILRGMLPPSSPRRENYLVRAQGAWYLPQWRPTTKTYIKKPLTRMELWYLLYNVWRLKWTTTIVAEK